jgi:hypothetical protein
LFLITAFFEIFLETTGEIFKPSKERKKRVKYLLVYFLPF